MSSDIPDIVLRDDWLIVGSFAVEQERVIGFKINSARVGKMTSADLYVVLNDGSHHYLMKTVGDEYQPSDVVKASTIEFRDKVLGALIAYRKEAE